MDQKKNLFSFGWNANVALTKDSDFKVFSRLGDKPISHIRDVW